MSVAVIIPWRPGDFRREEALAYVTARYRAEYPLWDIVLGSSPDGPFSRSAAIIDGVDKTDADTLVIADGDVWCDADLGEYTLGLNVFVDQVHPGWAVPHRLVHRLSLNSTERVLSGEDWRGLPLSTDNEQDRRPYVGHVAGTLLLIRRTAFDRVPPDPRFAGWGSEDDAWALALRALIGPPVRGSADLFHLWHETQPRLNRRVGTRANAALLARYHRAGHSPARMTELVEEGRRHAATNRQPV